MKLTLALDRSVNYIISMIAEHDTRQRIISSARELIYSRSYAAVGIAEICEQAQVQKGSFYHFFPSKQALSLAVIDELRAMMEARVLIPAFAPDLPPLQRLQRFTRLLHAFQQDAAINSGRLLGCPFGNLALEVATSDDIIRRKLQQVFDAIQLRFEHALQDAEAAGELGTIDIPATAQAMLAYIEGVLLIAKTRNDPNIIKRLGPAFADIRIQHTIA